MSDIQGARFGRYRVRGIYEMTYFVNVDMVVDAEDEVEAIEQVQDTVTAGSAFDQTCKWCEGPVITQPEDSA